MLILEALDHALEHADPQALDAATVELARTYAAQIDDADESLNKLGPKLLDCLEALHLSPRARAKVMKSGDDDQRPANPLDELRKKRERRASGNG